METVVNSYSNCKIMKENLITFYKTTIRLVNDTVKKYRRYSIPISVSKVSAIAIPILNFKSIDDTDTDTTY